MPASIYELRPLDWYCPRCQFCNLGDAQACKRCNQPRPAQAAQHTPPPAQQQYSAPPRKRPALTFGVGVIIFFVALIAVVAEFVLYFILGIGAAFGGGREAMPAIAAFFVWLMIMTVATGVLAPICGLIEQFTTKYNVGLFIMLGSLGVIGLGAAVLLVASRNLATTASLKAEANLAPGAANKTRADYRPDELRELLRAEYELLVSKENPHLNYIQAKLAKSGKGYTLTARHEYFSSHTLKIGGDAKVISRWIDEHRDELVKAAIIRVGVYGEGPYSSGGYYDIK
jgi:hypothetical protein